METKIDSEDEWLHSFYYFNEEIPSREEFGKVISDYLSFEIDMVLHGKEYLFKDYGDKNE